MPKSEVHICQCSHCQRESVHADKELHRQMNLLLSRLDEQQRRWYVAVESNRMGPVETTCSLKSLDWMKRPSGVDGKNWQTPLPSDPASGCVCRAQVDSRRKKDAELASTLEQLIEPETAGDQMSEQKWVRSSLRHLNLRLEDVGHPISPPTVGRLLRKLGYTLRVNVKKQEASAAHPERNAQFEYIQAQKEHFHSTHCPIISVDTKKKELIGNFKNAGRAWTEQPEAVYVHDFPQDAVGKAVPYGIYDVLRHCGTVYAGSSADTPEFAVAALARWWEDEGHIAYPDAKEILILADSGGSNGCRPRMWKHQLQEHFSDHYGLTVTVAHYPTGCSKWNPIEHRLFSQISLNWAGIPLRSFEILLNYIRGTTTQTGLTVRAKLLEGEYAKGLKVSDEQMQQLHIEHAEVCSQWNYTLRPRAAVLS